MLFQLVVPLLTDHPYVGLFSKRLGLGGLPREVGGAKGAALKLSVQEHARAKMGGANRSTMSASASAWIRAYVRYTMGAHTQYAYAQSVKKGVSVGKAMRVIRMASFQLRLRSAHYRWISPTAGRVEGG